MIEITRRLEFDAGHRVLGHEGKCKNLHGHRYSAEITVTAPDLDGLGRVIDFGVIKEKVGKWIDENWDHNMLLHPDDPLVEATIKLNKIEPIDHEAAAWEDVVFGRLPFLFPTDTNPTAENIASVLFQKCCQLLPTTLRVTNVRIYETPNSWADCDGRNL